MSASNPETPAVKPTVLALNRDDMMAAVMCGVRDGIASLLQRDLSAEAAEDWLYVAVRDGVRDAIWKIASDGTSRPGVPFYTALQAGTQNAMETIARHKP